MTEPDKDALIAELVTAIDGCITSLYGAIGKKVKNKAQLRAAVEYDIRRSEKALSTAAKMGYGKE